MDSFSNYMFDDYVVISDSDLSMNKDNRANEEMEHQERGQLKMVSDGEQHGRHHSSENVCKLTDGGENDEIKRFVECSKGNSYALREGTEGEVDTERMCFVERTEDFIVVCDRASSTSDIIKMNRFKNEKLNSPFEVVKYSPEKGGNVEDSGVFEQACFSEPISDDSYVSVDHQESNMADEHRAAFSLRSRTSESSVAEELRDIPKAKDIPNVNESSSESIPRGDMSAEEPKKMEVQRTYLIPGTVLDTLSGINAKLDKNEDIIDVYYDTHDFRFTSNDCWLRRRNNQWQLKASTEKLLTDGAASKYREFNNEDEILDQIAFVIPSSRRFPVWDEQLAELKLEEFARVHWRKQSFFLDGFKIVLHCTDFDLRVGEIQISVSDSSMIPSTLSNMEEIAKKLGFVPYCKAQLPLVHHSMASIY